MVGTLSYPNHARVTPAVPEELECGATWLRVSQVALAIKYLHANAGDTETQAPSLDREDPLVKGMDTHSSILAWRIPWTEEPGGLQSIGSQRVRHDE